MRWFRRSTVEVRHYAGIGAALYRSEGRLRGAARSVLNSKQKTLLRSQIEIDYAKLDQRVQSFVRQLSDAVDIEILGAESVLPFYAAL